MQAKLAGRLPTEHASGTNRVWRSATTLIEANALPLSQTTKPVLVLLWVVEVGMQQCMIRNQNEMHKLSKVKNRCKYEVSDHSAPTSFFLDTSLTFSKILTFPWTLSNFLSNIFWMFRPPSATVVSAEPFSHGTGTLRCLQKEMATYRHWSVSLWRDHVSHCRILSPDKTEWWLISTTLCGWRRFFVTDQLWLMTRISEEEQWAHENYCRDLLSD